MLRQPDPGALGAHDAEQAPVASTRREDSSVEWRAATIRSSRGLGERHPPRIGRYRLIATIGEGAMGTVHRAIDADLEREVAVKLVRGRSTEAARARLLREARALARFSHPNIISVFDVGIEDGLMYVVARLAERARARARRQLRGWLGRGESNEQVAAVALTREDVRHD